MSDVSAPNAVSATTALALPDDPAVLDVADDAGAQVLAMLDHAKALLAQVQVTDLPMVVEGKRRAEALRCYVAQKEAGHDAELTAAEIVRRAERCIALLIREGQEAGEIKKKGRHGVHDTNLMSPAEVAGEAKAVLHEFYAMADDVDEETFEVAVQTAKEENNLTRANIVRKVEAAKDADGDVLTRLAEAAKKHPPKPKRHELLRNTHHHDPVRIITETVTTLEGTVLGLGLLNDDDLAGLQPDQVDQWAASLKDSIKKINRFVREMTRERP